jgi:hypothetical protein
VKNEGKEELKQYSVINEIDETGKLCKFVVEEYCCRDSFRNQGDTKVKEGLRTGATNV